MQWKIPRPSLEPSHERSEGKRVKIWGWRERGSADAGWMLVGF